MTGIDPKTEKVARNLANLDRCNADYPLEVGAGFKVPMWITYVSAAQRMLNEQNALTKLKD